MDNTLPTKINLALIRQQYRPDGGAERFISRALDGLNQADFPIQATVIARNWQTKEGLEFIACNPGFNGRVARERSFANAVTQIIKEQNFTLVQSHERIASCDIFRAGDGVHATWLEQKQRLNNSLKNWFMYRSSFHRYLLNAEKNLYASSQLKAIICNSKMVLDDIALRFKVDKSKLYLIYNGLDLQQFNPQVRRFNKAQRNKMNLSAKDFISLFVGSGFERKGLKQSIQALALAPKQCKLVVLGKDKHQARYEKLANRLVPGQVIFAGVATDVLPFFGMADILLLPSLYDPFPNAISEALACGIPVLTSTQTGGAELLKNNLAGFAYDALDIKSLGETLTQLCNDSQIEKRREAAAQIGQTFELSVSTKKLMALYQNLIKGKY